MTFSTWACLRCVQELATILGPQNRIQGNCVMFVNAMLYLSACIITITVFMAEITSTARAEDAGGGDEDEDVDEDEDGDEGEAEDGDAPRGRAAPRVW